MIAIPNDVKIIASPVVIADLAKGFPALAWEEAGLNSQAVKNRIFVQPSARQGWKDFLATRDRNLDTTLPIHDIPDDSYKPNSTDGDGMRMWPVDDGLTS